ncbi:hypothetical protein NC653_017998 [Populus alba x Populus x berolinensis]|uniref:Uncharacterized protein n=1 Tax=Populus alba x Populus x berolinensis TaxID=444605 RepID=A0AAD6QRM5_9ROSI|nr:hypothetical protein NC653_017998 [Populus alba x Populus x berolinensis]
MVAGACIGDSVTLDDLQEFALRRIVSLDLSRQVSGVYNKKNCVSLIFLDKFLHYCLGKWWRVKNLQG